MDLAIRILMDGLGFCILPRRHGSKARHCATSSICTKDDGERRTRLCFDAWERIESNEN